MDMNLDSDTGYFDPSLTSVGIGYADLAAGAFGADDRFVAADESFEEANIVDEFEDREDLDTIISLGLHMSD